MYNVSQRYHYGTLVRASSGNEGRLLKGPEEPIPTHASRRKYMRTFECTGAKLMMTAKARFTENTVVIVITWDRPTLVKWKRAFMALALHSIHRTKIRCLLAHHT